MAESQFALPADFLAQVQTACKHYAEIDRPDTQALVNLALRAALICDPAHPTGPAGRCQALQQAIAASLAKLKPEALENLTGAPPLALLDAAQVQTYICLYLHIYKRDPFTQAAVNTLEAYLDTHYGNKIPRSTYFVRRKDGLEQLALQLRNHLLEQ
jgi:hypothetical protein